VLDVRDYVSIAALRSDLCRVVADYCTTYPHFASQSALDDFIFARVWKSPSLSAGTLETLDEFRYGSRTSAMRASIFILFLRG